MAGAEAMELASLSMTATELPDAGFTKSCYRFSFSFFFPPFQSFSHWGPMHVEALQQKLPLVWLWTTLPLGPQTHSVGITWSHQKLLLGRTQDNPKPTYTLKTCTFAPQLLKMHLNWRGAIHLHSTQVDSLTISREKQVLSLFLTNARKQGPALWELALKPCSLDQAH